MLTSQYERKNRGSETTDPAAAVSEIRDMVQAIGEGFAQHKESTEARLEALGQFALKMNRPGATEQQADPVRTRDVFIDVKTGNRVPVLTKGESFEALDRKDSAVAPSLGRVLRGIVLGGKAHDAAALAEERKALSIGVDTGGGFTVEGTLAAQWIDRLRSAMVLNAAGVRTVAMPSADLTLAKLTGDPACSWHGENQPVLESEATFGAVRLYAKTIACTVKLSIELAQDSSNVEEILSSSITSAMARAIDAAGLVGVTGAGAGNAPMQGAGVMNLAGRNTVTSIGAPTSWDFMLDGAYELMLDDVPTDGVAFVGHPALWRKLAKLKTGLTNDNTPLPVPVDVARIPKLWTTAAPFTGGNTCKAMLAHWADMLMGVRKELTVAVLRERFLGDALQIALLAYARCDFAVTRPESFCSLEGITVA